MPSFIRRTTKIKTGSWTREGFEVWFYIQRTRKWYLWRTFETEEEAFACLATERDRKGAIQTWKIMRHVITTERKNLYE